MKVSHTRWYSMNIECKFLNSFTLGTKIEPLQWLFRLLAKCIEFELWKYAIFGCECTNQCDRTLLSKWQFNTWFSRFPKEILSLSFCCIKLLYLHCWMNPFEPISVYNRLNRLLYWCKLFIRIQTGNSLTYLTLSLLISMP